jgi:hypothetical protein
MRFHSRTILVAEIFFLAALGYLASSVTFLLLPAYGPIVDKFASQLLLCELPIIVWPLIWGAKDQHDRTLEPAAA